MFGTSGGSAAHSIGETPGFMTERKPGRGWC